MRLVFMGTPDFAVEALDALSGAGHDIAAVFTRADTPKNRGMKLLPPPVKARALQLGIPVHQPLSLKGGEVLATLEAIGPEAIVVAAYGLMLPEAVLALPPRGCLNIHASLLPRWRGASPINACILHGDDVTGVTIMQMDRGLDTGDMLLWEQTAIGADETAGQLHDRLAPMGGRLILQALQGLEAGELKAVPQPEGSTYAHQIKPADCQVDFGVEAGPVGRMIRAYDPFPGAYATLGEIKLKLFGAAVVEGESAHEPGRILGCDKKGAVIACGRGTIIVSQVQAAGGRRMDSDAFFRGHSELLEARFAGLDGLRGEAEQTSK